MRRAIGIVRQSKDNDGDSPRAQQARIEDACARDGLDLLDVSVELDVSGGTPIAQRHGIRAAVERIEAREADVLVAAYFDRLFRSLRVQDEIVSRVEAAGGRVLALDTGQVTSGSAGQWLSATMLGAVAEYHRRATADRTADAQRRAVENGVPPWPGAPVGYRRAQNGKLEPDPAAHAVVAEAFRMRAGGAPIREVRAYLAEHGLSRSFGGVQRTLASRVYLGEIFHGAHRNTHAHPAIVDAGTFRAVQDARVTRGRKPKSDRLLARLGVLRCAGCGARMTVGSSNSGRYAVYRCPATSVCSQRASISAPLVEGVVVEAVKARIADVEGRASAEQTAMTAAVELERAQDELDALIAMLDPLEPAARARLADATAKRDDARERAGRLGGMSVRVTAADWDRLSVDARRALVRATVERVDVASGRGTGRVVVVFVGE
jgi:DNA invertase Pin-like site-specific DNA recombinase